MGFFDFLGGGSSPQLPQYQSEQPGFDAYANQMAGYADRYNPYVTRGNMAGDLTWQQYQQLINDPNFIQDKIAKGFSESPYQKYMQDMVSKRMNFNAANTGMLGSGAANRALQSELTDMTGKFEDNYINRGLDSYKEGLAGAQGLNDLGFKALGAQDPFLSDSAAGRLKGYQSTIEAQQRNEEDKYLQQMANKMQGNNFWGSVLGIGGTLLGGGLGGPAGAEIGGELGGLFGGGSGGYSPGINYSQSNSNSLPTPFSGNGGSSFNIGNWSF